MEVAMNIEEIRARNDHARQSLGEVCMVVLANSVLYRTNTTTAQLFEKVKAYNCFNDDDPDDDHSAGVFKINGQWIAWWLEEARQFNLKVTIKQPTHILTFAPLKEAGEVTNGG